MGRTCLQLCVQLQKGSNSAANSFVSLSNVAKEGKGEKKHQVNQKLNYRYHRKHTNSSSPKRETRKLFLKIK